MNRIPLYIYDDMPAPMRRYVGNYGLHFTKDLCDYAVSKMQHENQATGKIEPIEPWDKDQVEQLLKKHGVVLKNNDKYDFVYVANMARADFYKSSIADEVHLALYIKDVIDDPDGADGLIMFRWFWEQIGKGCGVDFSEFV